MIEDLTNDSTAADVIEFAKNALIAGHEVKVVRHVVSYDVNTDGRAVVVELKLTLPPVV